MRTLLPLALLALLLPACIDNSGGQPPDGSELEEWSPVFLEAGGLDCMIFRDDAFLWTSGDEVQAFVDSECFDGGDAAAIAELKDLADGLEAGEALIGVSIQLGGCLGEWGTIGFYLAADGAVVTAWALRADSAYGRPNQACTDDIGGAFEVYRVAGAADAVEADVLVGAFNPELPGAPALPGS